MSIKQFIYILIVLSFTTGALGANRGSKSAVTSRPAATLRGTPARKNFHQDIESVTHAHDSWKKAHLNPALYACQRNPETVTALAHKVADRIETSKKEAVASAKAMENTVATVIGPDATEVPASMGAGQVAALKDKADQLNQAKKKADVLDRLAVQVLHFYQFDMPKESAVDGNCIAEYRQAMRLGVTASVEYQADTAALRAKLDKLADAAQLAWRNAETTALLAAR